MHFYEETLKMFRPGYYKCKHQSAARKISVINICTSTAGIYGIFSFKTFPFRTEDIMNNGAWGRLKFYSKIH